MADLDYSQVMQELRDFRDQRGWGKYHTLPALARALSVEVAEVNEIFLWQDNRKNLSAKQTTNLKLEMADALTYLYYMCDQLGVTPNELVQQKHEINVHRHWQFDQD
ncbi:nucleotide pyrophosphohydrolase [Levilactobacillus fujinensis]|uniref:Nucleotide pyrophosphohydrolase n=1 Tax=Levilactobacillus fujinensis TaxID=2486024 RepID=A0ABW1TFT3_9LACO|nr:nucleotide pyrophosphohydrolase [Levilactobacillus fujinensis]